MGRNKKNIENEEIIEREDELELDEEEDSIEYYHEDAISQLDKIAESTSNYIKNSYQEPIFQRCIEIFDDVIDKKYEEDILRICSLANDFIVKEFNVSLRIPQVTSIIFLATYESILDVLKKKQSSGYHSYELVIANKFVIGYTDNISEDDEKQGNIIIYIKHLKTDMRNKENADRNDEAIELTRKWMSINIDNDINTFDEIAELTMKTLCNKYGIRLESKNLVLPIFTTVYECMVSYIKLKRHSLPIDDNFSYEINMLGCFVIICRDDGDKGDKIAFRPTPLSKAALKNDAFATSIHE